MGVSKSIKYWLSKEPFSFEKWKYVRIGKNRNKQKYLITAKKEVN